MESLLIELNRNFVLVVLLVIFVFDLVSDFVFMFIGIKIVMFSIIRGMKIFNL